MVGYEGLEVINPDGGTDDAETEAMKGRWKQEVTISDLQQFIFKCHYHINYRIKSRKYKYRINLHDASYFHKRNRFSGHQQFFCRNYELLNCTYCVFGSTVVLYECISNFSGQQTMYLNFTSNTNVIYIFWALNMQSCFTTCESKKS